MASEKGRLDIYLILEKGFRQWLTRQHYAEGTIKSRMYQLRLFTAWLSDQGIDVLAKVSAQDLENYSKYLHGRPIVSKTIFDCLSVLKKLNEYLLGYGQTPLVSVKLNVEKEVELERLILSEQEIKKLSRSCRKDIWGQRDEVILAIYYGCGLRSKEGIYLETNDIDFGKGLLHVRQGKGNRQRYVPLSNGVQKVLASWINGGHRFFSTEPTTLLLPNLYGNLSRGDKLNNRLKLLCREAGINKHITLHSLRHSIATHLLQRGMGLEKIGQFLGHSSLETTKLYTHLLKSIDDGRL